MRTIQNEVERRCGEGERPRRSTDLAVARRNPISSSPVALEKRLYTAVATATAGREGRAKTDDGVLDVALAAPRALGGNGAGTNPEQLFAAGYSACFGSAVGHIARAQKITTGP